MNPDIQNY